MAAQSKLNCFWGRACGTLREIKSVIGVTPCEAELIFDKYVRPWGGSRLELYYTLAWLKMYPKWGQLRKLAPAHLSNTVSPSTMWRIIRRTLRLLALRMTEIDAIHLDHPNNHTPHFPEGVVGSIDTFPVFVQCGANRYQPKYKHYVVKFQGVTNHLGFFAYLSGPHPGAMSDTTLARIWRLALSAWQTLLGDLAYLSVPNCLTPFKNPQEPATLTQDELEFNRIHQFYRARVEHAFGSLHAWGVIDQVYRGKDMGTLRDAVRVICSIRNMQLAFRLRYFPYSPTAV
jgi:hypothetical protein